MSWSTELIVKYKTLNDMITAGNITGIDKVENGTIAIVEEDNNNSYIFNGTIRKWKPKYGNTYSFANLPSTVDFNIDESIEIIDSTYKSKRKWTGLEWELQEDISNIMLSGKGPPTDDIGEYGNSYTDLNTGDVYLKNISIKSKIDLLSLYDSGTLTLTPSANYTLDYPREFFVDHISDWNEGLATQKSRFKTSIAVDGYLLFDFNGSPQKVDVITMIFGEVTYNPIATSITWSVSNDLITWQDLVVFTENLTNYGSVQSSVTTPTEYRYYRMSFAQGAIRYVPLSDLFFYKDAGIYNWGLVSRNKTPEILYSIGAPEVSIGIKDSKCIDLLTGDIYYKNNTSAGKIIPVSYATNEGRMNLLFNGLFTDSTVGGRNRLVIDFGSIVELDRIVMYCKPNYTTELTLCDVFGGDNYTWELIYRSPIKSARNQPIEVDLTSVLKNRSYRYFRIHWYSNVGFVEWEFYSDNKVTWSFSHNIKSIDASSFNNKLNNSIVSPQLLAEYINTQNPTVNITTDKTITSSEFNLNTKFKVINTEPLLITLPDLTSDFNNRAIEIIKLGKGDLVITTNTSSIGRPNNKVIINNTGVIGESIIIEYVHELTMYVVKNLGLTWLNTISLPTYPNIQSVTVGNDGITWSFVFSLDMISGSDGYNSGLSVSSLTMGVHTLTYVSGFETDTLIYTSNKYIDSTDTFPLGLSYTQPGQGINSIENNSIKSFSNFTVTNNSILTCPQIVSATIGNDGLTWSFVFNRNMNSGPLPNAFSVTMTIAGVINLTYSSGDGTNTLNYTGNVIITSGDSVSVGLNYSDTNKSLKDVDYQLILKSFTNFAVTNQSSV